METDKKVVGVEVLATSDKLAQSGDRVRVNYEDGSFQIGEIVKIIVEEGKPPDWKVRILPQ